MHLFVSLLSLQYMFRMKLYPSSVTNLVNPLKLLTNFHSFVLFSYKLGLVRTLVDTVFKINNTWVRFHNNINELTNILLKKCVSITHCGQRWETTSQKVLCLYQHIHNHDYKAQRNVDPILDLFCWTFFRDSGQHVKRYIMPLGRALYEWYKYLNSKLD